MDTPFEDWIVRQRRLACHVSTCSSSMCCDYVVLYNSVKKNSASFGNLSEPPRTSLVRDGPGDPSLDTM